MKKIKVLVTGAGSGVGQSIMKALKISKLPIKIISADINDEIAQANAASSAIK